jgi:predicted RNA-binding protein YlxR (DUF448 family)
MCRSKGDKRALIRLVCVSGNLMWDQFQRLPGRGGYVHLAPQCVSKMGQPGRWERILNLNPGTLAVEQVAEVAQVLMAKASAKATEAGDGGDATSMGTARRGGAAKKVRL